MLEVSKICVTPVTLATACVDARPFTYINVSQFPYGTLSCHKTSTFQYHTVAVVISGMFYKWYNKKVMIMVCYIIKPFPLLIERITGPTQTNAQCSCVVLPRCGYRQTFNIRCNKSQNVNVSRLVVIQLSFPIHWSQMLSRKWICSWSSAGRRCSDYIWVINNLIA